MLYKNISEILKRWVELKCVAFLNQFDNETFIRILKGKNEIENLLRRKWERDNGKTYMSHLYISNVVSIVIQ